MPVRLVTVKMRFKNLARPLFGFSHLFVFYVLFIVCGHLLSELFHTYSLYKREHFTINFYFGQLKGCIDLFTTNILKASMLSAVPLGKSKHVLLTRNIPILISKTTANPSRLAWCWNKTNLQGLQQSILLRTGQTYLNAMLLKQHGPDGDLKYCIAQENLSHAAEIPCLSNWTH